MKKTIVTLICILLFFIAAVATAQAVSVEHRDIVASGKGNTFISTLLKGGSWKSNSVKAFFKPLLNVKVEDGKLNLRLSIVNISGSYFSGISDPGLEYEVYITDEKNSPVYQWTGKKIYAQKNNKGWKPGKQKDMVVDDAWDLRTKDGLKVTPGKYKATVVIKSILGLNNSRAVSGNIKIEKKFVINKKDLPKGDEVLRTVLNTKLEKGILKMDFSLLNVSSRDLNITLKSGQFYDLTVVDSAGNEVYRWSDGMVFIQPITNHTFNKGGRMDYSIDWDLIGKDGNKVPAGKYRVRVEFKASLEDKGKKDAQSYQLRAEEEVMIGETDRNKQVTTKLNAQMQKDSLKLDFSLVNISGRDLRLRFNTSQRFNFRIFDSKGTEVYKWDEDKGFLTVIFYEDLKKGEAMDFSRTWDLRGRDGKLVPQGTYTVLVQIMANPEPWGMNFELEDLTGSSQIDIKYNK